MKKMQHVPVKGLPNYFKLIFNASPAIMSIVRLKDKVFAEVNDCWERVTGYSREEAIGRTAAELNVLVKHDVYQERFEILSDRGKLDDAEIEFYTKTGEKRVGLESAYLIEVNKEKCKLSVIMDITERKKVEEELKESKERYQQLVEFVPLSILVYCEDKIVFANSAAFELFGSPGLMGKSIPDLVHPDYVEQAKGRVKAALELGQMGELIEEKIIRANQEVIDVEVISTPMIYQGKPSLLVVIRDLIKRKRSEEALKLSEERFYKVFNNSPVMMSILRMEDNRYIDVNQRWLRVVGMTREEMLGRTPLELGMRVLKNGLEFNEALNATGRVEEAETQFRIKSGEIRIGLATAEIIILNNVLCRLVVINDITERKALEKDLARLDRLNLIGEMAASIGHEVRNPLTTIRGFLQLKGNSKNYAADKEIFDLMIGELDRANSIITEFLSLSKNKSLQTVRLRLNKIVQSLYPLILSGAMFSDNEVRLELDQVPFLDLDEKEIRQLILNLVRNGMEAMAGGGCLTIKTFTERDCIVLAISDQGDGIPSHVIEKIGTPFFTTKENGTGLGLAVCYSIVARHRATMQFDTSTAGTTFYVRFRIPVDSLIRAGDESGIFHRL